MNIFLHEIKAYRKSVIVWACSLGAISALYVLLYSAVLTDIEAFKGIMNNMPDIAKKLLSVYVDSLSTLEGFYSFAFIYIILCGAIQAMNLGVSIVSKEVREKTADFLLTKPVSRTNILTAKLLALLACLVTTNIIFLIITIPVAYSIGVVFDIILLLMIILTMFFVQLMFMSLGVIFSVLAGRVKSVISVSLSTVFGFFIVGMLGSVIGDEAVRYITPFKYFDLQSIVKNGSYEIPFLVTGAVFVVLAIIASYFVYIKKDVHSV